MFLEFLSLVDIFHLQKTRTSQKLKQKQHCSSLAFYDNKVYVSKWTVFQVIKIHSEVLARGYF